MKDKVFFGTIAAALISMSSHSVFADDAAEPKGWKESHVVFDCSTAQEDIAKLEAKKQPTSDKAVGGVLGVTPIGLATNVVTGGDKMDEQQKMEAEEHNRNIDARIGEIRKACPDSAMSESPLPGSE